MQKNKSHMKPKHAVLTQNNGIETRFEKFLKILNGSYYE